MSLNIENMLQTLMDLHKDNKLTPIQKKSISELYMNIVYQNQEIVLKDEDLKYFVLGWYIYKFLLIKDE